ncbi:hypothetical protein BBJ28_00011830 [Nothophytophthora sp. Chile5]|nr:hypothetical protein BBJ28_00011830 [Nothophytophthora sp. Chile5]
MYASTSDRFGAVELSPRHNEPLLVPGSTALEAMSSPCMAVSIRVVAAVALKAMHKGITSNPVVEVSLVHDDGFLQRGENNAWDLGNDIKGRSRSRKFSSASQPGGNPHALATKPFRSNIVKSTLNPIWNFDVDFGDVDTESVVGVLFVVRHVEKFGMVKKDIGQLMLSLREVMDLKMQTFHLQPTEEMVRREAMEGPSNRKSGKLTVRFNGYGVTSTTTAPSSYTVMTDGRETNMTGTLVAHEDEFGQSSKSIVLHDIRAEVRALQSFHQTRPKPGETWFAVNAEWIRNWLLFVSKFKGDETHNPGSVDNMPLISDDLMDGTFQIKAGTVIKKDFRMINKKSWEFYQSIYGGGPAIEVQIPSDCAKPARWLATLRLDEAGRVGSNYVDSD